MHFHVHLHWTDVVTMFIAAGELVHHSPRTLREYYIFIYIYICYIVFDVIHKKRRRKTVNATCYIIWTTEERKLRLGFYPDLLFRACESHRNAMAHAACPVEIHRVQQTAQRSRSTNTLASKQCQQWLLPCCGSAAWIGRTNTAGECKARRQQGLVRVYLSLQ